MTSKLPVLNCTNCLAPCCKDWAIVEVGPDEANDYMRLDADPKKHPDYECFILEHKLDGSCVHLTGDNRCGIYEHRPEVCRVYDCRDDESFKGERGTDWVGYRE